MPYLDKAKVRLTLARGSQEFGEIIFKNPSSQAVSMRVYPEDWFYASGGDGSKSFAPAATTDRSCSSWISFSPAEFSIPPKGEQRVSYKVNVPQDNGLEGGYYAVLFFESKVGELARPEQEAGAGLNLVVRLGALFYIEINGTVKRTAVIDNLSLKKEPSPDRLFIEADFRNSGNVDITASGTFHIMDREGLVYARGEFNTLYAFPGDAAELSGSWDTRKNPIPKGNYDVVLTIDLGRALSEAGLGRGPILTKEAAIEIGDKGEILRVGALE
ncbi:hypothetical protein EPN16_07630 [bacterium]|nr:MAG: hypothetical protein EPN16_07630 [bacterium]